MQGLVSHSKRWGFYPQHSEKSLEGWLQRSQEPINCSYLGNRLLGSKRGGWEVSSLFTWILVQVLPCPMKPSLLT